jgi:prepilin peptidase CpaA
MVGTGMANAGLFGSDLSGFGLASFGFQILFPFLMAYAAASDLLTMLIPNRISLALVASFALIAVTGPMSWTEIGYHVGAGAIVLTATFTLFAFGVIGGGDAKLAAATALWLGFDGLGDYLLVASLFGGGLTLAILFARSHPLPLRIARMPFALHLHDAKTGIPYGIALAAAALLVLPETELWTRAVTG